MTSASGIPTDVYKYVMKRDGKRCQKCRDDRNVQVDHLYPRYYFKRQRVPSWLWHQPSNLQVLCGDCNERKGIRLPNPSEVEALAMRDLQYRAKHLAFREEAERNRLVLRFSDFVFEECERRGDHRLEDVMDSLHEDWREWLYDYVLRGVDEDAVEEIARESIEKAVNFDVWSYASTRFRQRLGIAFNPHEVSRSGIKVEQAALFEVAT